MWLEMKAVFSQLSDDPSVRAIVFSGAGEKAFSTGLDLKAASQEGSMFIPRPQDIPDAARHAVAVRKWIINIQDCVSSIERCEKRKVFANL